MQPIRPLKELLEQADAMIKTSSAKPNTSVVKTASDVSAVLSALENAPSAADTSPGDLDQDQIDKLAMASCRLQLAKEIEVGNRYAEFEKKAKAEGFSNQQIDEVLSKMAADKVHQHLPLLVAMGIAGTTDTASPPNLKVTKKYKNTIDLTKAMTKAMRS